MSFLNSVIAPYLLPSVLWRTSETEVHLTFDDGPHPVATPKVLDILRTRGIQATFFVVGQNVQLFPDIVRRAVHEGHVIGNHSRSHRSLLFKSSAIQREEIRSANTTIEGVTGQRPWLFRPPFGYFDHRTIRLAESEGLKVVMWDVNTRDFSHAHPKQIVRAVTRSVGQGSIILHHDNAATAPIIQEYLEPLLDLLLERGLHLSALTQ